MTRLNSTRTFYLMWLFIVFVSVHDGCLVLAHRPIMSSVEQNPLGLHPGEQACGGPSSVAAETDPDCGS